MRRLWPLGALAMLSACGKEPTVVPVRNLERPADMTFVCMREVNKGGVTQLSGRPMMDCQPHLADPKFDERLEVIDFAKPRRSGTFGLVTNTSRGELGVVDMDLGRLVDLDPSQPGYNMVPLGGFPEVVAASQDGCMVVSANRSSCDLTVVDPQRLLRPTFGEKVVSSGEGPLTTRVIPRTASGRALQVSPQEIAFLPQNLVPPDPSLPVTLPADPLKDVDVCQAAVGGTPAQPTPWRAVVTFPACDLVAVIELPSGIIVSSMYVRPEGLVDAGTEPVCAATCGVGVVPPPAPDASIADAAGAGVDAMAVLPPPPDAAPVPADAAVVADAAAGDDAAPAGDGGAPDAVVAADAGPPPPLPVGPFRVGALAIRPEGRRLYVGGASAEFITAIDIDREKRVLVIPAAGSRIPLHEGPVGVRRLRLSLDPFEVVKKDNELRIGRFLGEAGNETKKYLYAFAGDNSVRVLNVSTETGTREYECDVNVDPRFMGSLHRPECYALPDDPNAPRAARRAFAQGPGLTIPLISPDQPPPVPQDIAFGRVQTAAQNIWNSGGFGYLVASDGDVYVVNVDSQYMMAPNNSIRDNNSGPLGQPGGAVVAGIPVRNFNLTNVPLPIRVPRGVLEGPRIEGVRSEDNDTTVNWVDFPDKDVAQSQTWLMAWEGVLPGTEAAKGTLFPPSGSAPAGGIEDKGQEFCQTGAVPGDFVFLPGCSQDIDCSLDGTSVCKQSLPGTPGLCFTTTQAKDTELVGVCSKLLGSRRRYQVVQSRTNRLDLALKPDELPKTALDHCQRKEDCTIEPFEGYDCLQVRPNEPKRCVKPCDVMGVPDDKLCRPGTVCESIDGALTGPLCVEGPKLIPACWPSGTRYQVQAGHAFALSGALAPHPQTARRVGELCVPDVGRNPLLSNRIPLESPHCVGVGDENPNNARALVSGTRLPPAVPGVFSNPCLFWGVNDDDDRCAPRSMIDPNDASRTILARPTECAAGCALAADGSRSTACHVKAFFQNAEVQFVVTNLEQYVGDANVTRFDVSGGFQPEAVRLRDDVLVTLGVRVLTGPLANPDSFRSDGYIPYFFVIDQGRTSSSGGGRGQVLRFNPRAGTYGYPQYDSNYNLYPFQIQ